MQPEVSRQPNVTIITIGPAYKNISQLDEDARKSLNSAFEARTADPPLVVIDLPHTTFFSSAFFDSSQAAETTYQAKQNSP